jgi:hypothetical protein
MSQATVDKRLIVVGKPLPFSIFTVDNKLLLAEGEIVKSEGAREALARNGIYTRSRDAASRQGPSSSSYRAGGRAAEEAAPIASPLERFARDHTAGMGCWRPSLRMSRDDAGESYATRILAVHDRQSLLLSAPIRADGTWVSVIAGQNWVFRTLYHTTALRFQANVLKTVFDPFPHLHVEVPHSLERRIVRKAPRLAVSLHATLVASTSTPALIVDLSVGGARIAVDASVLLAERQQVTFSLTLPIEQRHYSLELQACVIARDASSDPNHPDVASYRVQFEPLADVPMLTLHAFVNGMLAVDLDSFGRLIALLPGSSSANATI